MNIEDLEKPFATGRTAEIFAWQGDKVLKLFLPSIPVDWIDQETETGRYIQGAHLPVPKLYERVTVSGREGLVYERVDGPSLLTELATRPWKVTRSARLLARLHAQVHEVKAPAHLETQREWARGIIGENEKLPLKLRQAVLKVLEGLPDGEQLCHGDFHPGNILVTARGAVIIDWMTASRGTAAGDVARTAIILEAAQPPQGTPMRWLIEWIRGQFRSAYLKSYFQIQPIAPALFDAWRAVMAANFMEVCLPEEQEHLISMIEAALNSGSPA